MDIIFQINLMSSSTASGYDINPNLINQPGYFNYIRILKSSNKFNYKCFIRNVLSECSDCVVL